MNWLTAGVIPDGTYQLRVRRLDHGGGASAE